MNHNSDLLHKGYVQVYTGEGKGKTTAALGLAFRAMGRGLHTYIGQFMKGQCTGEVAAAKKLYPYITIEQYGSESFISLENKKNSSEHHMAGKGIIRAKEALLSGNYDIIVLDEINNAYCFQLVSLTEILDLIACKPERVELIFTGRYAPPELIAIADLVSEIVEVKHYYRQGIVARDGIEH